MQCNDVTNVVELIFCGTYPAGSIEVKLLAKIQPEVNIQTRIFEWPEDIPHPNIRIYTGEFGVFIDTASILNFFMNRSTNAAAESFNAKIKAFRATSRGVRDIPFFLFRLANIYA